MLFLPATLNLETQPRLELNHSTCQPIRRTSELAGVGDIGRRCRRNQRSEIQNIKNIEDVGTDREFGSFPEESRLRNGEFLAEAHIDGGITRAHPLPAKSVYSFD